MKDKTKDKYELIYLEWHDSTSAISWKSEEELDEWLEGEAPFTIKHVGWLLRETDKYIVLAGAMHDDGVYEIQIRHIQQIPKTWIIKRKKIRVNQQSKGGK